MGTPFSRVLFTKFEQALSADVNRMGDLISREMQNLAKDTSFASLFADLNGDVYTDDQTVPPRAINGVNQPPLISTSGVNFNLTVGAGSGFFSSSSGVGADDSDFQVVRWADTVVTLTSPDVTNPRIDLISATLGTLQTDPQTRNVLLDPVTRTVVQQTLNKTQNPKATIVYTLGTPAANPTSPVAPANSLPLLEVFVSPGQTTSSQVGRARRAFRRAGYPLSGTWGILSGCELGWTIADVGVSAVPNFFNTHHNAVVIDGEIIESGNQPVFFTDSVNPPTTDSPNNSVFYVYVVGGRHNPQSSTGSTCPFVLVISKTAPNRFGFPIANMTIPRGTVLKQGCVYVGVGFLRANGNRMTVKYASDWVYSVGEILNQTSAHTPTASPENVDKALVQVPITATAAMVVPGVAIPFSGQSMEVILNSVNALAGQFPVFGNSHAYRQNGVAAPAFSDIKCPGVLPIDSFGVKMTFRMTGSGPFNGSSITILGFNMNLPRLGDMSRYNT